MKNRSKSNKQTAVQPKRTVAATVYRPHPLPKVLQTKTSGPRTPVAPPVYRPETKKIIQPKVAGSSSLLPKAPPVYRPQPTPVVLQRKTSTAAPKSATAQKRLLLPHEQIRVVQRKEGSKIVVQPPKTVGPAHRPTAAVISPRPPSIYRVVQRAAKAEVKKPADSWTVDVIKEALLTFNSKKAEESDEEQAARIYQETIPITEFFGAVDYNCYAWALGETNFVDPGGTLSTWKHHKKEYNFLDGGSPDATILLWGNQKKGKEGKDVADFEILHASVLLTHAEVLARAARDFRAVKIDKATLKRIPNPFWSSALGFGFGVMVHPRDFFQGGDFGGIVAGMRKKA